MSRRRRRFSIQENSGQSAEFTNNYHASEEGLEAFSYNEISFDEPETNTPIMA